MPDRSSGERRVGQSCDMAAVAGDQVGVTTPCPENQAAKAESPLKKVMPEKVL